MINSAKFSRAVVCFHERNSALLPSCGLLEARNRCGRAPPSGALSALDESACAPENNSMRLQQQVRYHSLPSIVEDDAVGDSTLTILVGKFFANIKTY